MLKWIALAGLVALAPAASADSTYVRGHLRNDGTYVQPHYRTTPDSSRLNNWSTQGNYNPYTGRAGTVDPYNSNSGSLGSSNSLYGTTRKKNGW